ncbi:DegV family protein [Lysinibacillus sp. 54212]|uniref:DegV family protein n=1 Tax=Lysinibacillus sp. 54212 TaxID=3119829 RepID=UPI002FC9481F
MKIFTDSSCDLPKEYYSENRITLFPFHVHLNGQDYEDVFGIDARQIYEAMEQGARAKTSQLSPEVFLTHFGQLGKENEEGIYISISSEFSGTYNTAVMIHKQLLESDPDLKLTIIDSKCASLGQGLLVKKAVALRDEGIPYEKIIEAIIEMSESMEHLFTVGNLDYLARGGRLSRTSAFFGGLLNIKPILNIENGKLVPLEKIRGHRKAISRMIDIMEQRGGDFSNKIIGLSHSNDEKLLSDVKQAIENRFLPKGFDITQIGSAIGSHVGSGTVAIFFTNADYQD